MCEAVQAGLQSPAYDVGRYAPNVEYAMHHFHTLLHEDLSGDSEAFSGMEPEDLQQALLRYPLSKSVAPLKYWKFAERVCRLLKSSHY